MGEYEKSVATGALQKQDPRLFAQNMYIGAFEDELNMKFGKAERKILRKYLENEYKQELDDLEQKIIEIRKDDKRYRRI